MRIFISVDMEGIAGVVHVDHTRATGQDYGRFREIMTAEANAAALGAFDAGAETVVINDSHADMRNVLIDKLDPRVELISGSVKPLSMIQGLEERYDGAMFIGYHAGMGARAGVLDHTYHGGCIAEVQINGRRVNETGINALVAGVKGTPVILVAGDDRCCAEAKELLGEVETVPVKWAITRYSARSLHPEEARRRIREGVARAIRRRGEMRPFRMDAPYTLRVRLLNSGLTDAAEMLPGAVRVDATTLEYSTGDVFTMFRALLATVTLAGSAIPK